MEDTTLKQANELFHKIKVCSETIGHLKDALNPETNRKLIIQVESGSGGYLSDADLPYDDHKTILEVIISIKEKELKLLTQKFKSL